MFDKFKAYYGYATIDSQTNTKLHNVLDSVS